MIHFLLIYDVEQQKLVGQEQFTDADVATDAYAAAERQYSMSKSVQIVLVGADSLSTIQSTHGQYFRDQDLEKSKYLVGA